MNTRKLIRPIYLSQTSMEIPASMELPVPLNIYAGALQLKTKEYWIIFSSPKVGDFVVKVSIVPDTRAPQHILHPPFPTKRCNAPPDKTCEDPSCPRIIHIQIPSKNIRLWTAAKAMLSHTLNDVEKTFWDDYLETPLGLKLMAWISRQYHIGPSDMNFLFQSRVTYKVECNSPQVVCPSSITIEDVRSDKTVDLPIHISNAAKPSSAVDIKLRTDSELRYYQIIMRKPSRLTTQSSVAPTKEPSQAGDQVTCAGFKIFYYLSNSIVSYMFFDKLI
ncbi:hypothetical protein GE061_009619 [Apolygus lucorum]|uniref:Uncharacterized protein n=1 Tax=Apolygus lucorum TaxID=248454 RepID=A0A8S9Y4U8_APOLU|nr:hypothetical protein GE061_009619 [Apolygus lucorum]